MTNRTEGRPDPIAVPDCPMCGNRNVYAIWYGMPSGDPETDWPPNVTSAGCMVSPDEPSHACQSCGHQWRDPSLAPPYGTDEFYEWHRARDRDRLFGDGIPG